MPATRPDWTTRKQEAVFVRIEIYVDRILGNHRRQQGWVGHRQVAHGQQGPVHATGNRRTHFREFQIEFGDGNGRLGLENGLEAMVAPCS
ncbi:hypothetical protein [Pseudomonas sp. ANT_H12B]|uniref:hypothetical protein n=1 Tax=Pseudomonas sp. ANT_H12B TaxID=2597348 RepID=UPI0015B7867E